MLGADDDGVDAPGHVVVVVFDSHLALGVGTEVGHLLAFAADVGEDLDDFVGQGEGKGHEGVGLVVGVAEHHALVAGSLGHGVGVVLAVHAAVDVAALLVYGAEDAAALRLELIVGLGVADAGDGASHHVLQVDVGLRLHFAGHDHLSSGDEGFAGNLGVGVVGEELVEHSVGDLVGHLVGMALGNGFGCK